MSDKNLTRCFTEESFAVFTKEFAAHIMELQKEECAISCENLKDPDAPDNSDWNTACKMAAARIRNRGKDER